MQKVMIIGRVGRDPESRTTNGGTSVCSFSVACSEKRNGEEKTEWFRVKAFGKTADFCSSYLGKGRLVYVEGKLETQKYTKDGVERSITELLADSVQGLDRAENTHQNAAQSHHAAPSENMDDLPW
jgi:single-strand DNA-binding protein